MTAPGNAAAELRARRLLRWYPGAWRGRYGDEFAELLAAEIAEQPRSARRVADVAASGLRARLADAGLSRHAIDRHQAARGGTATFIWSGAAFAAFAASMWSQLSTGLQWQAPDNPGITQAHDLMSLALLTFAAVTLAGLVALVRAAIVTAAKTGGSALAMPASLALAGAAILAIGGRHFANAWPGTGGHLLAQHTLIPAGAVAFSWAISMWVTSYVAHPAALAAFPATQLAWMAVSLAAAAMVTGGVALLARRVDRSPRAIRVEMWLDCLAGAAMVLFAGGVLRWLGATAGSVQPAFHAGIVDVTGLAVLACSFLIGAQAIRQAGPPSAATR